MRVKGLKLMGAHKKQGLLRVVMPLALGLALVFFLVASAIGAGVDMRVSTDSGGNEGNSASIYPEISADGRYIAFYSLASNLVAGDTNSRFDVFVKDTQTGVATRVSTDSAGIEANAGSVLPSISADGRYIAFYSLASNLVAGDTNGLSDIFVKDTQTGVTSRVSTDSAGAQAGGDSDGPSISADGRYVAFQSSAPNLVAGDTNGVSDVFTKDTQTGAISRVSADMSGNEGNSVSYSPSISADGRYIAFYSLASNLVAGDTNSRFDVFVKDTQTGVATRVSTGSTGTQANGDSDDPSISADGRYVIFGSDAPNLVTGDTNNKYDIFVKDTQTGATIRVSTDSAGVQGNNVSEFASISADGRYVAFQSTASNLVTGDTNGNTDVFVKDTQTGVATRVSTDSAGIEVNDGGVFPSISANGRYVAFQSTASNLVVGDTNMTYDVFRSATSITCTPGKPNLTLEKTSVYWASYADYVARNLSVDFSLNNVGMDAAYILQVTDSTASNGVTYLYPVAGTSMGNLVAGASHELTLKYDVPVGVLAFSATVNATAQDGCGNGYSYP